MADHQFDRVVLAACSCCSLDQACDSCTFQRVRCKGNLLGVPFDLSRLATAVEFVNIREQCAWAHRDAPVLATAKARRLVAGAIAKVSLSAPPALTLVNIPGRVLVAGEGEAALYCADALRRQNIAVAHSDDIPVAISGCLGDLLVTLRSGEWQWQVEASAVVLAPRDERQLDPLPALPGSIVICRPGDNPSQVGAAAATRIGAMMGGGGIVADHNIARVNPSLCLGCGTCVQVCEHRAIRLVETPAPRPRDPVLEFLALTGGAEVVVSATLVAQVNPVSCLGCGTCAAHCPSSAILAGYSTDAQINAMLAAMLDPILERS